MILDNGKKALRIDDFKWPAWGDEGPLFLLTCIHHQSLRWATKHISTRNLHFLGGERGTPDEFARECTCSAADLVVYGKESEPLFEPEEKRCHLCGRTRDLCEC
jgi:hypothetical protein